MKPVGYFLCPVDAVLNRTAKFRETLASFNDEDVKTRRKRATVTINCTWEVQEIIFHELHVYGNSLLVNLSMQLQDLTLIDAW